MTAEPSQPNRAQAGLQKPLGPVTFVLPPAPGMHALLLGAIREFDVRLPRAELLCSWHCSLHEKLCWTGFASESGCGRLST